MNDNNENKNICFVCEGVLLNIVNKAVKSVALEAVKLVDANLVTVVRMAHSYENRTIQDEIKADSDRVFLLTIAGDEISVEWAEEAYAPPDSEKVKPVPTPKLPPL